MFWLGQLSQYWSACKEFSSLESNIEKWISKVYYYWIRNLIQTLLIYTNIYIYIYIKFLFDNKEELSLNGNYKFKILLYLYKKKFQFGWSPFQWILNLLYYLTFSLWINKVTGFFLQYIYIYKRKSNNERQKLRKNKLIN